MKILKTLLFEYKELLNRDIYGEWITNENKIIPVLGTHGTVLSKYYKYQLGTDFVNFGELYIKAFLEGFVRVEHHNPNELGVEGIRRALKRVLNIIKPSISQIKIGVILFTILDDTDPDKYVGHERFSIPEQRSKLINFMDSL